MQVMPSEAVSQGPIPVPEPDPSSQHGMETADTEREQSEGATGEGEVEGEEEVISVNVESSESLQPSTSQELVRRVSEPVQQEASVEMTTSSAEAERGGGEEERERESGGKGEVVAEVGEDALNQIKKPVEQVCTCTVHSHIALIVLGISRPILCNFFVRRKLNYKRRNSYTDKLCTLSECSHNA